jgi:hypothetical protein
MAPWVAACLLVGAASLWGPSEPSFDPWAWLVWGREIAHLSLDTTAGPSWKPLPVAFTTMFAPFSVVDDRIPPALWVVVARAGGLLALVLAAKVAAQVVGGGRARRVVAGAVAVFGLVLTPDWVRYLFHANEAPLCVGLTLWAVERHLAGRPELAFGLGTLVCLARPELFGFLLLYGAWMGWRMPATRALVAGLVLLVVAAWLLPPWVGEGDPFAAGVQASSEPSWSLSLAPTPWRAALELAQSQAWLALELTALAALALSLVGRGAEALLPRPARPGAVAVLAGFCAAVVGLYLAMTEAGFSGNPRYVLLALASISLLGGVGAALIVDLGRRVGERVARPAGAKAVVGGALGSAAVGGALLIGAAPELRDHVESAEAEAREAIERSRLHRQLETAVDTIGAGYITRFGPATTNRSYQTHLAWELSLPLSGVHGTGGRGIVLRAPARPVAGVVRIYPRARRRVTFAHVGAWTVSARPPHAGHVFTWPIVGFSLCVAAARHLPLENGRYRTSCRAT